MHGAKGARCQLIELRENGLVDVLQNVSIQCLLIPFIEALGQYVHEFSVHSFHCDAGNTIFD